MIEKLKTINPYDETEIDMDTNSVGGMVYENTPLIQKLNELVDAVNELQLVKDVIFNRIDILNDAIYDIRNAIDELQLKGAILEEHAHPTATTKPTDPYAEQRKWIGCVCRFWYDNPNDTLLDYLDKIQTGKNGVEYYAKESGDWFPHCEPVKPDDDIIYKGDDDE